MVWQLHRGTYRYRSPQDPRTELRMRIREIAPVRIRYGYRKIPVLLQRGGWTVGKTAVSRRYREEGLALRRPVQRRRRVAVERRERPKAPGPNPVWSLDFVAEQLADGRRFRALTVVDVYTRESLAIEGGQGLQGEDAGRVLQRIQRDRGVPKTLFCDHGSECSRPGRDLWAYPTGVKTGFSRPGKPTDHAPIESCNGTFRQECLNAHWFTTLWEAKQIVEGWRREYNESRPHRALGEKTLCGFAFQIVARCDLKGLETAQNSP